MATQLCMIRPHMKAIPRGRVPRGFRWRRYRRGDAAAWVEIIGRTLCQYSEERFLAELYQGPHFDPRHLFFIVERRTGKAVGTACAGRAAHGEERRGYLHFLGVLPESQGRGLGKALVLLVLRSLAHRGFKEAILQTDDFRLAALRVYLQCGFVPLYLDDEHRERWRAVFEKLGMPPVQGVNPPASSSSPASRSAQGRSAPPGRAHLPAGPVGA